MCICHKQTYNEIVGNVLENSPFYPSSWSKSMWNPEKIKEE